MEAYENYPLWVVAVSNLVGLSIYALGAYILLGFGLLVSLAYLLYCIWIETNVLKGSCVDCHYYGELCAFGKGKICSMFFRKGDPKRFAAREISWSKMLPDMMTFAFPLAGGAILLWRDFTMSLVVLLALLLVLVSAGNAVVRGSLACKRCKQRELGCPAEKLFNKPKAGTPGGLSGTCSP